MKESVYGILPSEKKRLFSSNRKPSPEVPDMDEQFEQLIDGLDPEYRKHFRIQELIDEAETTLDFAQAIEKLNALKRKRDDYLDKIDVSWQHPDVQVDQETLNQLGRELRFAVNTPSGFLGNGAVAEVYTFRRDSRNLCVKWIKDYERYAEGAHILKEIEFMDRLEDLVVDGVRAPKPFFAFKSMRMEGIVMEQLNATNFQRVLERQTTEGLKDEFPPVFNLENFFDSLENYVKAMHTKGVFHGDLFLRNIMIDRETGLPYLIDYGKAVYADESSHSVQQRNALATNDLQLLRKAKTKAKKWIDRRVGK